MDHRSLIQKYIRALFGRTILLAALIIDVVAIFTFGSDLPNYIYPIVLAVGFLIAGYQEYYDLHINLKKLNETLESNSKSSRTLQLSFLSVEFGGHGWQNNMPMLPMRFLIKLDRRNPSNDPFTLTSLDVKSMDLSTDLFTDHPQGIKFYESGVARRGTTISLPIVVPPENWNPSFLCEVIVGLSENDPIQFAKQLQQLSDFAIVLVCSYEGISGREGIDEILVEGNYSKFKQDMISHWRNSNSIELIRLATE